MTQLLERRDCASKAVEIVFMQRQTEAQQIIGPLETPAPDVLRSERRVRFLCFGVLHEAEQSSSPKNRESRNCEHGVEFTRPALRWSGARPRAERQRDAPCDVPVCDSKSQPKPRETVKLPKRAQNHDGQINAQPDCTDFGLHVRKGFIYDQPSAAILQQRSGACQRRAARYASVGIIGIHDHYMADSFGKVIKTGDFDHLVTGTAPGQLVFMISRPDEPDRSAARELRAPLR